MAQPTCQLRSLINGMIGGRRVRPQRTIKDGRAGKKQIPGTVFWATLDDARDLIGQGWAEPVVRPAAPAAPAVPVAEVPEEKKDPLRCMPSPERRSVVDPVWKGGTVVCIASGPSLTREDVELVRQAHARGLVHAIVVNDSYLIAPFADISYFADAKWWRWHRARAEFKAFRGQKCSIFASGNAIDDAAVHILQNAGTSGLSLDPAELCTGSNSGHQALNVATLSGATRILLLGYDAKRGDGNKKHHFGEHPDKTEPPYETMRAQMRAIVQPLKSIGTEVINCTPGSAIDCFPRSTIKDALAA